MYDYDGCMYDTIECYHTCKGCRYGIIRCEFCHEMTAYDDDHECISNNAPKDFEEVWRREIAEAYLKQYPTDSPPI